MKHVIVHVGKRWHSSGNTFVTSRSFLGHEYVDSLALARLIENRSEKQTQNLVSKLNGYFSIVKVVGKKVLMVSDPIRSVPLFYAFIETRLLISDDPYWLQNQGLGDQLDEDRKNEFRFSGIVCGANTLNKHIKQIQGSEILKADCGHMESCTYNQFKIYSSAQYKKSEMETAFRSTLEKVFTRVIRYADKRTIVIPLSGGYDSRLIATMLKKLYSGPMVTYSFGKKDNHEAIISKKVAERLGLKWIFIPYDNHKCYHWYNSDLRKKFGLFADHLCSIIVDREFPAVMEMKKNNLIPAESLFVPGYVGDFIPGGYLLPTLKKDMNEHELIEVILKRKYAMWNWQNAKMPVKEEIYSTLQQSLKMNQSTEPWDAIQAYAQWSWREIHVKIIANMVKIPEFFGYDWWMPFNDRDYIEFWSKIPIPYRKKRVLYNQLLTKIYAEVAQVSLKEAKRRNTDIGKNKDIKSIVKYLIKKLPGSTLERLLLRLKPSNVGATPGESYDADWEQSFGKMNKTLYDQLKPYIVGRSSCATLERLGYISYTSEKAPDEVIHMLENRY